MSHYASERLQATRTPVDISNDRNELLKAMRNLPEPHALHKAKQILQAVQVEQALGRVQEDKVREAFAQVQRCELAESTLRPQLLAKMQALTDEQNRLDHAEKQAQKKDAQKLFEEEWQAYRRMCKDLYLQYRKLSNMTMFAGMDVTNEGWNAAWQNTINLPPLNESGWVGNTGSYGPTWTPR